MLDFYLLEDSFDGDANKMFRYISAEDLRRRQLGSVDIAAFHTLQHFWDDVRRRGVHINYFEDVRLLTLEVKIILETIAAQPVQLQQALSSIRTIFEQAQRVNSGIYMVTD